MASNLAGTIFSLFENNEISVSNINRKNSLLNMRLSDKTKTINKIKFSELEVAFPFKELKRKFIIEESDSEYNTGNYDELKFGNEIVDDDDFLKEIKIIRLKGGWFSKEEEILIFVFNDDKIKILYTGNKKEDYFYPKYYDYFMDKGGGKEFVDYKYYFSVRNDDNSNKEDITNFSNDINVKNFLKKIQKRNIEIYTFTLLDNSSADANLSRAYGQKRIKYKDLKEIVVGYETDKEEKEIKEDEYWADKVTETPINFIFDPSEDNAYYYEVKYKGKDKNGEEKEFIKYTNGLTRDDSKNSKGADVLGYFTEHIQDIKFESSVDGDVEDGTKIYKAYIDNIEEDNIDTFDSTMFDETTGEVIEKPTRKKVRYENGKIVYSYNTTYMGGNNEVGEDDLVSDAGPTTGKLEMLPSKSPAFVNMLANFESFRPFFYFCSVGALTYGFGQTIASSDDDKTLFEEAVGQFEKKGTVTINEVSITPKILGGHLRLTVANTSSVNLGDAGIYSVYNYKSDNTTYHVIANTATKDNDKSHGRNFYDKIIVKAFGVKALENRADSWEKRGTIESNWEWEYKNSYVKTDRDAVIYKECQTRFASAINNKTLLLYNYLFDYGFIKGEAEGYSYDRTISGFEKVIKEDAGPASIFRFLTQKQLEDLVNTKYQGHWDNFFGPLIGMYKEERNKSSNKGLSNYVIFCRVVVAKIKERIEYIKTHPKEKYLFRDEKNRNDIISHFTLSEEKEASLSGFYNQQIEKNKKEVEAKDIGAVNIDIITITAIANRKFTIISRYKKVNTEAFNNAEKEKSAVYYVELEELSEEYLEGLSEAQYNPLGGENTVDWEKEKKFMNRWSINYDKKSEDFEQVFIDVDKYYDFYSGMTPYIEVHFRDNDGKNWNVINSVDHPYIKSLQVVDKGVKKITLQLFDKDFASYQIGVLKTFDNISYDTSEEKQKALEEANVNNKYSKNIEELKSYRKKQKAADNAKRQVYSLDTLIKRSLMTINEKEDEKGKETYGEDPQRDLETGYLKISEYNKSVGPGNLKIRYGYCDDNPNFSTNTAEKNYNSKSITTADQTGLVEAKNVNIGENDIGNRTNRWWDVRTGTSGDSYSLIWEHKIEGDKLVDGRTTLNNGVSQVRALAQKDIGVGDDDKQETINDKSTLKSYLQEYMIVGYKTTLANNGILYTIEGIEVKDVEVMKKRFLQRYAEVSSYPLEVLYVLMRIFNESENNKIIDNGVKILYLNDDPYFNDRPTDSFNMDFDFSGLDESAITKAQDKFRDVYWANKRNEHFSDKYLKKINLNFGSEGALVNYSSESKKPSLYKSLDSLIGEFCSACPTRKEYNEDGGVVGYDKDGNEIKNEGYKAAQTLSWMTTKNFNENDKTVYIILYYKKIRKLKTIKKYTWGPNNPNKHIVKRIQIQNNNEFALLSSVTTTKFDGSVLVSETINNKDNNDSKEEVVSSIMRGEKLIKDYENESKGYMTTYAAEGTNASNNIERALKMSMYNGTMELLGDPGLEFNLKVQPYMYPIYLDVLIPINDLYFNPTYKKEIEKYDQIYGSIGNKKLGNQKRHELSGFYVITEITHNISSSGYTTTIGVSKYPKIEDDILTDTTKSKIRYNKS